MADNTTRVTVEGSDNGFSSMLDKIRQKARETFEELKLESESYADDVAGQIAWVEAQLKQSKKDEAAYSQAAKAEAIGRMNQQLDQTQDPAKKKEIRSEYADTMRGIRQDDAEGKVMNTELADLMQNVKEIFADMQRDAQEAHEAEQQRAEEQQRDAEAAAEQQRRDAEEARRQTEEEDEEEDQEEDRNKRSSWNPLRWFTGGDVKDDYQEDDTKPSGGGNGGKNGNGKDDDEEDDDDKKKKKKKEGAGGPSEGMVNRATNAAGEDVFHMVPALIAAIPFAAGLGALAGKAVNLGSQMETAEGAARGATGIREGAFDGADMHDKYQLNMMGYTRKDAYENSVAFARAHGHAGKHLAGETMDNMATMKAYDLDQGTMLSLEKMRKYDKRNDRGAAQQVENLRGIMGVGNDNAKLVELITMQNKLTQMQTGTIERVNSNQSAALLKGFEKLGGSFADDRAAERIQTVNQSLTNPNNEFKQALSYSVLRQANPDADLFELKKMQEKGVLEKGYLEGVMKQLQQAGGSESLKKYQLMEYTNLSAEQTEKLYDGYQKDPNFLDDVYSNATKRKNYGLDGNYGKAQENTGAVTRESAVYSDLFAGAGKVFIESVDKMGLKVLEVVNQFTGVGEELLKFRHNVEKHNHTYGNKR